MSKSEDDKKQARIKLEALIAQMSRATSAVELAQLRSSALGLMAEYGISDWGSLDIALANGLKSVTTAEVNNHDELKTSRELENIIKEYQEIVRQKIQNEEELAEATKKLINSINNFLNIDPKKDPKVACQSFNDILQKKADCIAALNTQSELLNKELESINKEQEFLVNQHKQLHKPQLTEEEKKQFNQRRTKVKEQQAKNQDKRTVLENNTRPFEEIKEQFGTVTKDNIAEVHNIIKMQLQLQEVGATT